MAIKNRKIKYKSQIPTKIDEKDLTVFNGRKMR